MEITKITDDLMYQGDTKEILMPGGFKIVIRETNGNDDDILSRIGNNKDGTMLHKFLASVIIGSNLKDAKVTEEDVASWRVRDKYYAALKVRQHSLGNVVTFKHKFADGKEFGFDENLEKYDWDFTKGLPPSKGQEGYSSDRIKGYDPERPVLVGRTSKGRNFKMNYLTGIAEQSFVGKDVNDLTINDKLRLRNFEVQMSNGQWVAITNFAPISSREMSEIRSFVDEHDPDFPINTTVTHPETKVQETVSLLTVEDFFFPRV